MKIYTSYFGNNKAFPKGSRTISIARSTPKWFDVNKFIMILTPSWKLLDDYKKGRVDEVEYSRVYKKENLDHIVIKELKLQEGDILLCWEKKGDFCHRHLVADFLIKKAVGIEVEEL